MRNPKGVRPQEPEVKENMTENEIMTLNWPLGVQATCLGVLGV